MHPLHTFTQHMGQSYLKCLYFLLLHMNNTEICSDHILIFWFPWVLQFYTEWCMSTTFLVFFVCFSAGKTWILYRIKSCSSQKGTTIDTPLQQDKTRMTNDIQAFRLSMLLGKWIYKRAWLSLDVLLYGYVDLTGLWL